LLPDDFVGWRKSMRDKPVSAARIGVAIVALAGAAVAGGRFADRLPFHQDGATTTPAIIAPITAPTFKSGSLADMVAAVGPSVVQIQVKPNADFQPTQFDPRDVEGLFGRGPEQSPDQQPQQGGLGSGFIVDAKGIIVTNNHVVGNARSVTVQLSDGRELQGRVLGRDKQTDIAVVQIEGGGNFKPVGWGDSDHARVGDTVFAVGSPFGLGSTVTSGIVSARGREIGAGPYDDFLQVDAAINSGNSGGPLFDSAGRVIGVNTAIFSPSGGNVGIGFAIPAQMARRVAQQIVANGHVARGRIGVALQAITPEIARAMDIGDTKGALIADIDPTGSAANTLQQGDIVQSFGARPVDDPRDLARMVADAKAGSTVQAVVIRGGKQREITLRIGGETAARTA
jgi:serine protease Do